MERARDVLRWAIPWAGIVACGLAHAQLTQRVREPIVLAGSTVPSLLGADPARIVGFGYDAGWVQVPVQVDQRAAVDFGTILHATPLGLTVLTYTDPSTFTGADPNPAFDADDEVAFMSGGAEAAPGNVVQPAGTLPGTGVRIGVLDPLSGEQAFLYLFVGDGTLDPAAGEPPIGYAFTLLSGAYKTTYNIAFGPNPEDSWVVTPAYSVHFADRWVRDATLVTRDGATGVDILDRHRFVFSPGVCTRTEQTFTEGQGAFMFNRTGPVRALRGYMGANSGVTTYRTHAFYATREEILTALRVHTIPGLVDFFDYSPAAAGMTYRDSLNPAGVPVDGTPDALVTGAYQWQMITGAQGTLVHVPIVTTDIPLFAYNDYYADDRSPSPRPCTGDAAVYAASGFQTGPLPSTDPAIPPASVFQLKVVIVYAAPNRDATNAETINARVRQPLTISSATPAGNCPDVDLDGRAACGATCLLEPGQTCGDCNDGDAQVFAPPAEVAGVSLRRVGGVTRLAWNDQGESAGSGTAYDVVTGSLASLTQFSGFGGAGCLASAWRGWSFDDPRPDPPAASGSYYLLRARNTCGTASYGRSSVLPDPRATLDASALCP
jgi:hypothetical protein